MPNRILGNAEGTHDLFFHVNPQLIELRQLLFLRKFGQEKRPLGLSPIGLAVGFPLVFDQEEARSHRHAVFSEKQIDADRFISDFKPLSGCETGSGVEAWKKRMIFARYLEFVLKLRVVA